MFFLCINFSCCAVLSHSVVSDWYCNLMDCSLSRLLCPWGFYRPEYWSGLLCPPPGDHPNLGIEPRSPALQIDSLPSQPPGSPKYAGVGSLSLLQGSSRHRNRTGVSCTESRSSTREQHCLYSTTIRGFSCFINVFHICEKQII